MRNQKEIRVAHFITQKESKGSKKQDDVVVLDRVVRSALVRGAIASDNEYSSRALKSRYLLRTALSLFEISLVHENLRLCAVTI